VHQAFFKAALLAVAFGCSLAVQAQLKPPVTPAEFAAEFLPAPRLAPGDVQTDCVPNGQASAPPPMESPAVMAQYRKNPLPLTAIYLWARKHLNASTGSCFEWRHAFRKLQDALGHEATGVLTLADLAKVSAALAQGEQAVERKAQAAVERQDLNTGRARTLVDFLPSLGRNADRSCNELMGRAQAKTRQEVARRVAQLPLHMMRPAYTEAIEREEIARAGTVAPQWQAHWQAQPALEQWARANDCNVPLRIKVEAWQLAIGSPVNAQDAQGIASSEQWLAKAEESLRQFDGQLEQSLQAEADRSGETARARQWALDTLSARSKLGELAGQIPTALCTAGDNRLRCAKRQACADEQQAAAAARGQRGYDQLTRPLAGRFEPPAPSVGRNVDRLAQAEDALKVCMTRHPYSAAAKSELLFLGQTVGLAELDFDTRGLVAMRLTLGGNADVNATRNALTRRYGLPETQQEIRRGVEMQMVGGGTGVTSSGQQVLIAPTQVAVPTSYTVTKYIWKSAGTMVEHAGSAFDFRFTGN